ncbi:NAD(P)-binding domain-containing protein (plasmid) [Streptomyces sp. NBC_00316]|nr:NAD(P)-binding domain-containing protein [Streptomyces sp. NBC_00316]
MKIGTIRAGTVSAASARQALTSGHQVVLSNSRGPASLQQLVAELGRSASAGTRQEAAAAEIVLVAVPWPVVPMALDVLPAWDGRILIGVTNQFASLAKVSSTTLGTPRAVSSWRNSRPAPGSSKHSTLSSPSTSPPHGVRSRPLPCGGRRGGDGGGRIARRGFRVPPST